MAGELSKQGIDPAQVLDLMGYVTEKTPALQLIGLMTIGPMSTEAETIRPAFQALRELRNQLAARYPTVPLPVLSMGMSNDYPIAVEEGATHVRVGRALFAGLHSPSDL
jgi:uncharacterized pyridoxal phosphate-containing UPF0001 family protein